MGKELILKNIHFLYLLTDRSLSSKIRRAIFSDRGKAKEIVHALREVCCLFNVFSLFLYYFFHCFFQLLLNVAKRRIAMHEKTEKFFKKNRTQLLKFIDIK